MVFHEFMFPADRILAQCNGGEILTDEFAVVRPPAPTGGSAPSRCRSDGALGLDRVQAGSGRSLSVAVGLRSVDVAPPF